jgi:hypothetical protein
MNLAVGYNIVVIGTKIASIERAKKGKNHRENDTEENPGSFFPSSQGTKVDF